MAAVVVSVAALMGLARATDSILYFGLIAMAIAAGAWGSGFAGEDPELDRTASVRWPVYRAAHLLVATAVAVGVVLALWSTVDPPLLPPGVVWRDLAGLAGLTALGAVTIGGRLAWAPPLGWAAILLLVPPDPTGVWPVITWLAQPEGSTAALITAVVLGVAGFACYAGFGPRPARW
ncbi:hypothetical protein [Amycolatopsis minnesotensis]|uniref:hypothetical protein n=1 Tax=Amycolatopsis minnesotensis TaxID=337894 RepID=UPI0031E256C6